MSETIIDSKKFSLMGKPTEKGMPRLSFSVYRGNPSITVFTNDPSDTETKPIRGAIGHDGWGPAISLINSAINGEPGVQYRMELRTGHPKKTIPDTTLIAGRDESSGVVWICVAKQGRPAKRFELRPSVYYNILDRNGNPLPDGEQSVIWARGWIDSLNKLVMHFMRETYEPPQPQQGGNRGGYNGGGNRGGYNGGGGQQNYQNQQNQQQGGGQNGPSQSFDDDIPL